MSYLPQKRERRKKERRPIGNHHKITPTLKSPAENLKTIFFFFVKLLQYDMLAKCACALFSSPWHLVRQPKEMLIQWVTAASLPGSTATKLHCAAGLPAPPVCLEFYNLSPPASCPSPRLTMEVTEGNLQAKQSSVHLKNSVPLLCVLERSECVTGQP